MSLYAPVVDGYLAGPPTTLPGAMRDVYGCGNAAVARLDRDGWRVVVRRAGSSVGPLEHVPPTGREGAPAHDPTGRGARSLAGSR